MFRIAGACMSALLFVAALASFRLPEGPIVKEKGKVNWMTIEEAYARAEKEPRKILVDLYTDWCGWCKVMDRETYSNREVAEYVNSNYYPVKFNAEQRKSVRLGQRNFVFVPSGKGGVHQLALSLTNNRPSYPTTVFVDEQKKVIQPLPGYLKPGEFFEIVTFFGGDHYKTESFESYKKGTFSKLY